MHSRWVFDPGCRLCIPWLIWKSISTLHTKHVYQSPSRSARSYAFLLISCSRQQCYYVYKTKQSMTTINIGNNRGDTYIIYRVWLRGLKIWCVCVCDVHVHMCMYTCVYRCACACVHVHVYVDVCVWVRKDTSVGCKWHTPHDGCIPSACLVQNAIWENPLS